MKYIVAEFDKRAEAFVQTPEFCRDVLTTFEQDWRNIFNTGREQFEQFLEERTWLREYSLLDAFICYLVEYFPTNTWVNWPRERHQLERYFYQMGIVPPHSIRMKREEC